MECIFYVVLYADAILLLSTSLSALQSMLNIFESFAEAMDITYNSKKIMVIRIYGYVVNAIVTLYSFVVYLGIYICSAKRFKLAYDNCKLKFYIYIYIYI